MRKQREPGLRIYVRSADHTPDSGNPLTHTLDHQTYYDPYSIILALSRQLSIVAVYQLEGLFTSTPIPEAKQGSRTALWRMQGQLEKEKADSLKEPALFGLQCSTVSPTTLQHQHASSLSLTHHQSS